MSEPKRIDGEALMQRTASQIEAEFNALLDRAIVDSRYFQMVTGARYAVRAMLDAGMLNAEGEMVVGFWAKQGGLARLEVNGRSIVPPWTEASP